MASPLLSLSEVSKSFGTTRALDDISFDLVPGEVHALVGENGAGKSTLLSILTGVVAPDSGTIAIDGKDVSIDGPARAQALGIGTVFQELSLAGSLTVAENIFAGRLPTVAGFVQRNELRPIVGAVAQKSYLEAWLGVHLLHWLNTDAMKVVPDWKAAGINPLPETVATGVMPITRENVTQFKH